MRTLASHQCGPGSIPAWCYKRVEFVVNSRLAPRVFIRVLRFNFLPPQKNISKFQFDLDGGPAWKPALADVASSLLIWYEKFTSSVCLEWLSCKILHIRALST